MELLLKTLLALSVGGTALALILMLVNKVFGKRLYSGFVYYAWLLVLLRFVLPVPGLLYLPAAGAKQEASAETRPAVYTEYAAQDYGAAQLPAADSAAAYTELRPDDNVAAVPEYTYEMRPAAQAPADGKTAKSFPYGVIILCLWAAGAIGTAGWNLYGYFSYRKALYRTLKPARESDLRTLNALHSWPWPVLYRSGAVSTPLLMGLLRPVIVLPDRDYSPAMLDGILRHELTHYSRGDLIVKWFAAGVCCVHWFNPIVYPLRSAIDRACELSCDERLLKNMDKHEKQSYGELLLELAANRPLPRQVVAVSFATEKRNLKERLVQIMTFKKKGIAALSIMLAVLVLLAGCAMAVGPASVSGTDKDPVPSQNPEIQVNIEEIGGKLYVDSVDEFLAALGSDRTIVLRDGTYDLTTASDYASMAAGAYYWEEVFDGFELVFNRLEKLNIVGENGAEAVSIVTLPRYANVIRLEGCDTVAFEGITAGHTPEQGACSGGVLQFNGCDSMSVNNCVLYGCGTEGISTNNSRQIFAEGTTIKECSIGAIYSESSYDVRFMNGKIFNCGLKDEDGCYDMLYSYATTGFAVHNTEIYGNISESLLHSEMSFGVEMRGCSIHDNRFSTGFTTWGNAAVLDGCELKGNSVLYGSWYHDDDHPAIDGSGAVLSEEALENMKLAEYTGTYDGPVQQETVPAVSSTIGADGREEYHVKNVDEFLGVIGSNRVIYLDAESYDLSQASSYGGYAGSGSFCWQETYDGPELVISNVQNMSIIGKGKDKTTVETLPRYADVLAFVNCEGVTVENLTAGHIRDKGECSGDVLSFDKCHSCTVSGCGLFGCGVQGIDASMCSDLNVKDTEIYECSYLGASLYNCWNTTFTGCSIHDCGSDTIVSIESSGTTWDGKSEADVPEIFARQDW